MRDQALPINPEFISFGLSTEDRVIVEDQAGLRFLGLFSTIGG